MDEFKKIIKFDFDNSSLKNAQRSIDELRNKIDDLNDELKLNDKLTSEEKDKIRQQIRLNKILIKNENEYLNVLKNKEQLLKNIKKIQDSQFKQNLKNIEEKNAKTPIADSINTYFDRYKGRGLEGFGNFLTDQINKNKDKEVASFDESIKLDTDKIKKNNIQINKLQTQLESSKSYEQINDEITDLEKQAKESGHVTKKGKVSAKSEEGKKIKALQAEAEERKAKEEQIKNLNKQNVGINENIKANQISKAETIGKAAAMAKAVSAIIKVIKVLVKPFVDLFNAVSDTVKQMLDLRSGIATFSTNTSLITNSQARDQQLKYGLTNAQNYAFTQAKSMLNISSEEDLMYMNQSQRDKLLQYMEKYSNWYQSLENSGVLQSIQEMQLEFEELKQEIAMEFLSWVAANKDTIMTILKGLFEFMKGIMQSIINIFNFFSGKKMTYASSYASLGTSDYYNTQQNNQKTTNINIQSRVTNSATDSLSSESALERFNEEYYSKLSKQLVQAIGE